MKKIISLVLCLVFLSIAVLGIGLGVSPSVLDFKQPLPNKEYTRTISVQTTTTEHEDMAVSLTITNYTSWFSYPINLIIPKGQRDISTPITLKAPKNAKTGHYETTALAKTCEGMFCIGVQFNIIFELTREKIITGEVGSILISDTYYGKPLCVRHSLYCMGNTPCKFHIIIDTEFGSFWENYQLEAYSHDDGAKTCVNIDGIPAGFYHANTKVYLKTGNFWQKIAENNPHFNIFEYCIWC